MIARLWHGTTATDKASDYLAFLQSHAVPDYRSVAGNEAVHVLHRQAGNVTHFLIITHWRNAQAIEVFAGSDIRRAKYYAQDREFLLEFEAQVQHYVLEDGIQ